jgi:8-hydroxy-5-deazaflavin:NADPH oxidoreductase
MAILTTTRRRFLSLGSSLAAYAALPRSSFAAAKMKIGILGAGNLGGDVGQFLAEAGYPVMLSARDLGPVQALAAKIGHGAQAGTPEQAASFGEVIVMAIPWGALPQVGKDYAAQLKGKIVIDTCNPRAPRDGDLAKEGLDQGTGVTDPKFLPGTRLVRAFNALNFKLLASSAHHPGELIAVPLASDDKTAMNVVAGIVRDCGFEPVVVGGLSTAKSFDQGTPDYGTAMTAKQLRAYFHI